ncbi:MAG TPA: ATP-binding protein [Phycisphaerae bacterium]|nr:ATP-binding protein [Phycisphaerae bacterium]
MNASLEQLDQWLNGPEDEHCEFKQARTTFSFDRLAKYCSAMANEGGGKVLLGVTDKRPRKVVGTQAFLQYENTRQSLIESLHLGVVVEEIHHPRGRVLVFHVPSRPKGTSISYKGIRYVRDGQSLVTMSDDRLRKIFAEGAHDFSAEACPGASLADLDPAAVEDFRRRWIANKPENQALANLSHEQLLTDAEALVDGRPTYAALVLFGTHGALGRHLAQAEVVFEYRSSDASGPAQERREYRQGFFTFYDELWNVVNLRNDKQHYQEGLFVLDIPTFSERPVREAILNAVSHRDYQLAPSVFIRQYPRRLEVVSPGGLPVGITVENILYRQFPRNRRIAEIFGKCGLVERSGQGMDLIFQDCVRHSKRVPDFGGTDQYQVSLTLHGTVRDPNFIRFLERIGKERQETFDTGDWQVLNAVSQGEKVPEPCRPRVERLVELGVIERVSRGKLILSRRYHELTGRRGAYTRKRGLDRETNKELLLKLIRDSGGRGAAKHELLQVLPALSPNQVYGLLKELRAEGKIRLRGRTRGSTWHPGARDTAEEDGGA